MELYRNIVEAHGAIRPQVAVTPLQHSSIVSAAFGCNVLLKHESMQPTGSFKIRGATNKVRRLAQRGVTKVIAASTGNHGLAVARAGALAGVAVTVYVANSTVPSKLAGIRALGAELVVIDGQPLDAELAARRRAEETGLPYISPYNDLDVVAGQGTLGVELLDQEPGLDAVFIAVGAGGLIGGTGTAIKAVNPRVKVVGVWPEASPCMLRALEAGRIVPCEEYDTLSDATAGAIEPGSVTFPICQSVIDRRVLVSEKEIAGAMRMLAEKEHLMVEGAAGVALAGLAQQAIAYAGQTVAVVLCGRNIGLDTFIAAVS
ncbi:MAG TPA: threonine/serine dehydratase [Steroidobacter sp.]|uniref:threonine/serine dehydratase n=1 Tax=Steroidobacter sp. TaxID=1978227 RepID=UPI002EDAE9F0